MDFCTLENMMGFHDNTPLVKYHWTMKSYNSTGDANLSSLQVVDSLKYICKHMHRSFLLNWNDHSLTPGVLYCHSFRPGVLYYHSLRPCVLYYHPG